MGEDENKVQLAGTNSEVIRGYCGLFHNLFDDIYGPGTSEKLFNGRIHAGMCDAAYAAFISAAKTDAAQAAQRRSEFNSRYTPQNRQQRRNHNRHNQAKKS